MATLLSHMIMLCRRSNELAGREMKEGLGHVHLRQLKQLLQGCDNTSELSNLLGLQKQIKGAL